MANDNITERQNRVARKFRLRKLSRIHPEIKRLSTENTKLIAENQRLSTESIELRAKIEEFSNKKNRTKKTE